MNYPHTLFKTFCLTTFFLMMLCNNANAINPVVSPDTITFWYIKLNDSTIFNDNENTLMDSSFKTLNIPSYKTTDTLRFYLGGCTTGGMRDYIELRNEDDKLIWIEGQPFSFEEAENHKGWYNFDVRPEISVAIKPLLMVLRSSKKEIKLKVYYLEGERNYKRFLCYIILPPIEY